jgi:iron complex outermembrane receptor protein
MPGPGLRYAATVTAICLGMSMAWAAAPAPDIDAPDAIVVTARKIREAAIDVPASISVVPARQIEDARLRGFADIVSAVPNVAYSGGIAGQLQGQLAIRGIATLVRNIGIESGVGIYIDGVYIGRPETYNQELLDVAQVEVLRGPQGTVFGKNTIAGVFNITTGAPTKDLTGNALFEGGSYGLLRAQGTLSGAITDKAEARLSFGYARRNGFDKNVSTGPDADRMNLFSWRGALALHPSDALTLTLRTDGLRDRGTPGFFSQTDLAVPVPPLPPHRIDNNQPNFLHRDVAGGSLDLVADLGGAELTSITAYRRSRYRAAVDDDQRQFDFLAADNFGDTTRAWSQEVRVSGKAGDTLSYLAGLYFLDQSARTDRALALGTLLIQGAPQLTTRGTVGTRSYAAFANVDWRPIDRLALSAGIRYTSERRRADFVQGDRTGIFTFVAGLPNISFSGRQTDHDVSPTVSVTYAVTPDVKAYARVARGFKSAAFNVDLASSAAGLTAGPERATTYEGGVKANLADHRVDISLSGFHTSYSDLQVAQITGGGTTLSNAGKASINGFEAEMVARLFGPVRLEASAGYADGKYDRFANCAVPLSEGGGAADCAGKRLTGAPRFTARGAVAFVQPVSFGHVIGRIEADHQSSVYFEPTNSARFKSGGRTLLRAKLGVETAHWGVSAWAENLTNKVYETYRDDRTALGVLRTTAYGAPRTFGVTLTGKF